MSSLKIGTRITLGFAVVAALLVALAACGWYAGRTGEVAMEDFAEMNDHSAIANQGAQALLSAQVAAKYFMLFGEAEALERAGKALANVHAVESAAEQSFQNPEWLALLAKAKLAVTNMEERWQQLVAVLERRKVLAAKDVPAAGERLETALEALNGAEASYPQAIAEIAAAARETADLARRVIDSEGRFDLGLVRAALDASQAGLTRHAGDLTALLGQGVITEISNSLDQLVALAEEAKTLSTSRQEIITNGVHRFSTEGVQHWSEIALGLEQARQAAKQAALATFVVNHTVISVVAGFALVLSILAAVFTTQSVVEPISRVSARLREVAEGDGDLTQRLLISGQDETAQLARYFNTFVGRVEGLVREVHKTAREVAEASGAMVGSTEDIRRGSAAGADQAHNIAVAIEQMSRASHEVALRSGQAMDEAHRSGSAAQDGHQVVMATIADMHAILESVQSSAEAVRQLGARGEQIGAIIQVIDEIAAQTNLLALNAAIEAARAGEHGRGFAVVADEVRALADRTTQATRQIATSIQAIQDGTSTAVTSMSAGSARVEGGSARAETAGQSLNAIVTGADRVASLISVIATAAEQQSTTAAEINNGVNDISKEVGNTSDKARQVAVAAQQLAKRADGLLTQIGRFRFSA